MARREPVRNGISHTTRLGEVDEEHSQRLSSCFRGGMTPVGLGVDHFALEPPPDHKGPADLGVQIFERWSKFLHPMTVHAYRYRLPNAAALSCSIVTSPSGHLFVKPRLMPASQKTLEPMWYCHQ